MYISVLLAWSLSKRIWRGVIRGALLSSSSSFSFFFFFFHSFSNSSSSLYIVILPSVILRIGIVLRWVFFTHGLEGMCFSHNVFPMMGHGVGLCTIAWTWS